MSLLAQRQQQGQQAQGQQAQNAPTIPENVPQPEEQPQVQYAAKGGRLNGVAGLPANIFKFAHGGIVAFDGTDGSKVEDPNESAYFGGRRAADPEAQKREMAAILEAQAAQAAAKARLAEIGRAPGLAERARNPNAMAEYNARVESAKNPPIEDSNDPAVRQGAAPQLTNVQDKRKETPNNMRQNSGIATRVSESPSATPSMPSIPVPDMNQDSFVKKLIEFTNKQKEAVPTDEESRNKQIALNKLLGIKSIGEGSEQRAQAERDEYNASKKERALNDLQALLSAGARRNATGRMQSGTMGETGVIRAEANRAADAAFNKAQRDREEALAQLRRAELVGDRDKIVAAREKVEGLNRELEKAQMHTFGNLAEMSVRNATTLHGQAMQNAQADRQYALELLRYKLAHQTAAQAANSPEKQMFKMVMDNKPEDQEKINNYIDASVRLKGGESQTNRRVNELFKILMEKAPLVPPKDMPAFQTDMYKKAKDLVGGGIKSKGSSAAEADNPAWTNYNVNTNAPNK
jgi:hypothetical protein